MARPLKFTEEMLLRMTPGTLEQIDALLRHRETRADLVRVALSRELRRRQASVDSRSRNNASGTSTAR